ncbi:MAG: TonB-dependent receptor [Fibrobacterota bacterium]
MVLRLVFCALSATCLYATAWEAITPDSIAIPVASKADTSIDLEKVEVTAKKTQKEVGSAKNGYRHEAAQVGPLGEVPIKDIPYSINVTSGELIENQGAHTPQEALKTNPTVAPLMNSNQYSSMSRVMIRGFSAADQSELRDGLGDRSFTFPPLEPVERIEVMNGMSGFLYGFSSIGGTVNYISKQPVDEPLANLSLGQYGNGINFVKADLGGPLSRDSSGKLSYRAVAYREQGETYIEDGRQRRTLLYGAVQYRLSEKTTLNADAWRQDYYMKGLTTLFAPSPLLGIPIPAAYDPTVQYGQPWTYNESEKSVLGLRMNSKMSPMLTVRAAYRYGDMWRKYKYIAAKLLDNAGNYSEQLIEAPSQGEFTHSAYALADAKFKTWLLDHAVTFGYQGSVYYYSRGDDKKQILDTSNVSSSGPFLNDTTLSIGGHNTWQSQNQDNLLVGDRIEFNSMLSALVGINYAEIRQKARSSASAAAISTSNYIQGKFSPSLALTYKPCSFATAYASYMQGLEAGGFAPTYARNKNEMLKPASSEQFEIGGKGTFFGLDVNLALFRITKISQYMDLSDSVYKQDGEQQHQGLEVTASGKIFNRLTLVGGGTLLTAEILRARNDISGTLEGKKPENIPEQQARAYAEYALPWVPALTISAGLNYSGQRNALLYDTTSTTAVKDPAKVRGYINVPVLSYVTADAGLCFEPVINGLKTTFNLSVSNLADEFYWAYYRSASEGLCLGLPRIVSFSVKVAL